MNILNRTFFLQGKKVLKEDDIHKSAYEPGDVISDHYIRLLTKEYDATTAFYSFFLFLEILVKPKRHFCDMLISGCVSGV